MKAAENDLEILLGSGMELASAEELIAQAHAVLASSSGPECWSRLTREVLRPNQHFAFHLSLYEQAYADWDRENFGPPPAWFPDSDCIENSNINLLMRELAIEDYRAFHRWSAQYRERFWERLIDKLPIRFKQNHQSVVDLSEGPAAPRWLPGARLNIADSCFQAEANEVALIYQAGPGLPANRMTYGELDRLSKRVANGLCRAGFQVGDALAVVMPMTDLAIAIYLGIVKAGCVVVSIADSFAPHEMETRLNLSGAKGVFTQLHSNRGGKRHLLYRKITEVRAPGAIVILSERGEVSLRKGDQSWDSFLSDEDRFESVACGPHDPINFLFSSGTTGEPKTIPWNHTTPIRSAVDAWLHHDVHPSDILAWPSNLGWMMGPWLIFATMINRATMAIYDDVPTGRGFCRFVQDAKVTMLGLVPSLVKAWRNTGCLEGLDWTAIRAFSSTGECSNMEDMLYLMSRAGYRPVIEYLGGTEIGGGYITGTLVQPSAPNTFSTPALGSDFVILGEDNMPANKGELFLIPPSIGWSIDLLHSDHHQVYFEGTPKGPNGELLRRHGDRMEAYENGYYRAHGRADDTMNLAGIKVSTTELESAVNQVEGVVETAAIAFPPPEGGPNLLVIYAVLRKNFDMDPGDLKRNMQQAIRSRLSPLFKIHETVPLDALPRTASNKVMRRVLRARYSEHRGESQ